jgi:hypothetical protein
MMIFWIFLTLWMSKRAKRRGVFQVAFRLMRSETTRLEELGRLRELWDGKKEGIEGIQGEFQIGMEE